eukprot:scaffold17146_cov34-Prasinocladus_malaysianus.AAC.1
MAASRMADFGSNHRAIPFILSLALFGTLSRQGGTEKTSPTHNVHQTTIVILYNESLLIEFS